jgi:hypothetical protein
MQHTVFFSPIPSDLPLYVPMYLLPTNNFGVHCSIVGFSQDLNNPKIQCLPTMLAPVAMRIYMS